MLTACLAIAVLAAEPLDFPSEVGATWTYDLTVLGQQGTASHEIISAHATETGREVTMKVSATIGGSTVYGSESLLITSDSILRSSGPTGRLRPPLPLLKWPAQPFWNWSGSEGAQAAWAQVSGYTDESFSVPAGRFRALQTCVEFAASDSPPRSTRYWFANGTGWVRIEVDVPGGQIVMALRSLTMPRAYRRESGE